MEAVIANEAEQPDLVRPSRDTMVEALLAIYRRHIRDGRRGRRQRRRDAAARRSARPAGRTCRSAASPICGDAAAARWSAMRLCGCCFSANGRPIATRSNTRSMFRHAQVGQGIGRFLMPGTDRRLRRGRLSADYRLYRR